MATQPEITERDLRLRAQEILDAVEAGRAFTLTRDSRAIGRLIPLRSTRRYVTRTEFVAGSRDAPDISLGAFRADQDTRLSTDPESPV